MVALNKENANRIPDEQTIAATSEQELVDETGKKVKFGSLIEDQKTVVVFVRELDGVQEVQCSDLF
jgi:hypothetical protein